MASPDTICEAIKRGISGQYGEIYRIDGILIIQWIQKRIAEDAEEQELAAKMGFGRVNF